MAAGVFRRHSYLLLLFVLMGAIVLGMTESEYPVLRESAVTLAMALVFIRVFDRPMFRAVSLIAGLAAVSGLWYLRLAPEGSRTGLEVAVHLGGVLFFALAVAMVLQHLFERRAVSIDDILGTLCGFLLAAMAWANFYAIVALLEPGAFYVQGVEHPPYAAWHARESLFLYFSLATITTVGYGDVTPVAPIARSAAMFEGVFGQFYIAVVVAQLVGSKLAEARPRD